MTEPVKHILVAEDCSATANVVRYRLAQGGFQVTLTRNGSEAWEQIQKDHFDLVLTDYQMPEMNGIELCRRLRESDRYTQVPVILMSVDIGRAYLDRLCPGAGVSATLKKPVLWGDLLQKIEDCLAPNTDVGRNK